MWFRWRREPVPLLIRAGAVWSAGQEHAGDLGDDGIEASLGGELTQRLEAKPSGRMRILLGPDETRWECVKPVMGLTRHEEKVRAAAAIAGFNDDTWHMSLHQPTASSNWLVIGLRRSTYDVLKALREAFFKRICAIESYPAVVLEDMLEGSSKSFAGLLMDGALVWAIGSAKCLEAAGQVTGLVDENEVHAELRRIAVSQGVDPDDREVFRLTRFGHEPQQLAQTTGVPHTPFREYLASLQVT